MFFKIKKYICDQDQKLVRPWLDQPDRFRRAWLYVLLFIPLVKPKHWGTFTINTLQIQLKNNKNGNSYDRRDMLCFLVKTCS